MRPLFSGERKRPAFRLEVGPVRLEGAALEARLEATPEPILAELAKRKPKDGDAAQDALYKALLEKVGKELDKATAESIAQLVPLVKDLGGVDPQVFAAAIFDAYAQNWEQNVAATQAQDLMAAFLGQAYDQFRGTYLHELFPQDQLDKFPTLKGDKFPFRPHLALADQRTKDWLGEASGLYLGKYVTTPPAQAATTKWLEEFYVDQGNALNSPEGIAEFRKRFPEAVGLNDWQVRRIIDTSISNARNFAHVESLVDAGAVTYAIAGPNDNLTCPHCRGLLGQTFTVAAAKKVVDEITTQAPTNLPALRPFLTQQVKDPKDLGDLSTRLDGVTPPFHPFCRHRIVVDSWDAPKTEQTATAAQVTPKATVGTHVLKVDNAAKLTDAEQAYVLEGLQDAGLLGFLEKDPLENLVYNPAMKANGEYGWQSMAATNRPNMPKNAGRWERVQSVKVSGVEIRLNAGRSPSTYGSLEPWGSAWSASGKAATKAEAMRRTGVHEFLHHVHFRRWDQINDRIRDEWKVAKAQTKRLRTQGKLASYQVTSATAYAETNHLEWWTETGTAYVYDPEGLKAHNPRAFALVETLFTELGLVPRWKR